MFWVLKLPAEQLQECRITSGCVTRPHHYLPTAKQARCFQFILRTKLQVWTCEQLRFPTNHLSIAQTVCKNVASQVHYGKISLVRQVEAEVTAVHPNPQLKVCCVAENKAIKALSHNGCCVACHLCMRLLRALFCFISFLVLQILSLFLSQNWVPLPLWLFSPPPISQICFFSWQLNI